MNIERIEALVNKHLNRDGWSFSPDGDAAHVARNAITRAAAAIGEAM